MRVLSARWHGGRHDRRQVIAALADTSIDVHRALARLVATSLTMWVRFRRTLGTPMQPSAKACHLLATYMLLSACSYAPRATVAGTGSVTFSHDKLSPEMHMLVVTANPGVLEVGDSLAGRNLAFANRFATQTCGGTFSFLPEPQPNHMTSRASQGTSTYTFRCGPPSKPARRTQRAS